MGFKIFVNLLLFAVGLSLGYWTTQTNQIESPQVVDNRNVNATLSQQTLATNGQAIVNQHAADINAPIVEALPNTGAGILAYLTKKGASPDYQVYRDKALRRLITENPHFLDYLLENLVNLESPGARDHALNLISRFMHDHDPKVASLFLEKLRSGKNFSDWIAITNSLGVGSPALSEFILNQLPLITKEADLNHAVSAIGRSILPNRAVLSPQERQATAQALSVYRHSPSADTRLAVISTYNRFPPENMELELLSALDDSSPQVRASSAIVAAQLLPDSSAIKNLLWSKFVDPSLHILERQNVAFALDELALTSNESLQLEEFYSELDRLSNELTVEQAEALWKSVFEDEPTE